MFAWSAHPSCPVEYPGSPQGTYATSLVRRLRRHTPGPSRLNAPAGLRAPSSRACSRAGRHPSALGRPGPRLAAAGRHRDTLEPGRCAEGRRPQSPASLRTPEPWWWDPGGRERHVQTRPHAGAHGQVSKAGRTLRLRIGGSDGRVGSMESRKQMWRRSEGTPHHHPDGHTGLGPPRPYAPSGLCRSRNARPRSRSSAPASRRWTVAVPRTQAVSVRSGHGRGPGSLPPTPHSPSRPPRPGGAGRKSLAPSRAMG